MNKAKRTIALLLCFAMVLSYVTVHSHAADGAPNVTVDLPKTEVAAGDVIDVWLGINQMSASSVAFGFDFDNTLLQVTGISIKGTAMLSYSGEDDFGDTFTTDLAATSVSTKDEANNSGHVGCVWASDTEVTYNAKAQVVRIRFKALKAGTIEFEMFEDSAGHDGYLGTWIYPESAPDVPTCEHTETKLVPNGDGTHNVVCTNTECNHVVTENVPCSGTDDGDHTTAVMCACGNIVTAATEHTYTQNRRGTLKSEGDCNTKAVYAVKCDYCNHESDTLTVKGEYGEHNYGELIEATEAVHTQTELKPSVEAHYQCTECETYFTEGKVETTLAALTGTTPTHTEGTPVKNTEQSTDPTCTEGGTLVEDVFCTECNGYIRSITTTVSATCTTGTVSYTWGDDYADCTAYLTCEHGEVLKEEKVTTTYDVTAEATCLTAKEVTYYADFTADWAEDQSIPVTGEKNPDNHENLDHTAEVPAVCDNSGLKEYWYCSDCGKFFADADAQNEIENWQAWSDEGGKGYIPATGHGKIDGFGYDPNEDPINTHTVYCKDCGLRLNPPKDCVFGDDHVCDFCEQTETMTVTFMNGDSTWTETTVPYGLTLGIAGMPVPEAPSGKHFTGWYTVDNVHVAHGMTVTNNLVAYATWKDDHVCTHDHYAYIGNNEGHVSVCSCGKELGNPEEHKLGESDLCVCGAWLFTMDYNGGADSENPGEDSYEYYKAPDDVYKLSWSDVACKEVYTKAGYVFAGFAYDADGQNPVVNPTKLSSTTTVYVVWACNHDEDFHEYSYIDNRNGTHTVKCECGEILDTAEPHNFNNEAHKCLCEKVEEFTLTVNVLATGEEVELTVPYGANLLEVLSQAVTDDKIPALDEPIEVNIEDSRIGEETPFGYSYLVSDELGYAPIEETFTMPAGDLEIDQDCIFTGWDIYDGNYAYMYDRAYLETGWHYIEEDFDGVDGGAWYYFYEGTGDWEGYFRAEGLTRAPYPSEEIKGITYAPDADAVASDPNFIDATEAWFMFGDDGKFQYDAKGIVDNSKLVNGMLAWHPGLVKNPGSPFYHYFLGNEEIGGNIGADGDVWVTRIAESLDRQFVLGGIYTFEDSKLCEYTGITEVGGKLRFYGSEGADENRLMAGNGLTKVGENFIYVRSNGELVVNANYYVPTNDKGIVPGTYHFDENGFLVNPELTTKNGIVAENGGLFFYENGKIAYNKGLIQYNGGIIYVRSNGQLAVGEYYVTNLANFNGNDVKYGDKVTFGDDGYMVAAKNGIVDGMYYIDNQIAYNAGVVQLENGKYIYVKSNGTVVMNTNYWITNVGDTGVVAKLYSFDANGYFTPEFVSDQKDGIVNGYYYENGSIAYGKGLIYLEDEDCYIYVRSNGKLATGIYWPTATNGYDFSGRYDFGNDGKLYI